MKQLTIFDFMNQIYLKSNIHKYDKKIAPSYMLSLWFSHDNSLLLCCNKINKFQFGLSDDIIYKYYMHNIPKGRRFLKCVKKDKKKEDDVNHIAELNNISKRESEIIFKQIGDKK